MTPRTVTLFFALLALASIAAVATASVLTVLRRTVPAAATLRDRLTEDLRRPALALAAVVASVATLGSLYLSEVAGFPPCRLCWVQRGFMYPLAVLLVVLAARRATGAGDAGAGPATFLVTRGARLWALAGGAVSAWHVAIERLPALGGSAACDPTNPCTIRWVEHLGFITIPVMALAAFALVAVLLSIRPHPADASSTPERTTRPNREPIA